MAVSSVVVRLQPTLDAPSLARTTVREACVSLADPNLRAEAELLTSELVTNAVMHGDGVITLAVECEPDAVAVAVGDAGPLHPTLREVPDQATHGRGLHIVDALAGAWGVRDADDAVTKFVWFSLP